MPSLAAAAPLLAVPATTGPDLKKYMDKRLQLKLNGNRHVTGVLRGFDQFMNLVLDETIEEVSASERNEVTITHHTLFGPERWCARTGSAGGLRTICSQN